MQTLQSNISPLILSQQLENFYPIDVAAIISNYSDEQLTTLIPLLDKNIWAQIIEQLNSTIQQKILVKMSLEQVIAIFEQMSKDDVVDLLGELPFSTRKAVLKKMKEQDRKIIESLQKFPSDSAGGIMTTEYIALNENLTMAQALAKIKEIAPESEIISVIYLLNNEKQLVGTINLRQILIHKDNDLLKTFQDKVFLTVYPDMDQEEVSQIVSKYDLIAIPVINHRQQLLGIITVDDIIDVIIDEQTEDLLGLGGVDKEERLDMPLLASVSKRLPWLLVNLLTAFLASFTVGLFQSTIQKVVVLASVMSIVAGMGGNAGTQTLSLMIRSIALGKIQVRKEWQFLSKEFCLSLINGAVTGLVTGVTLYFYYHNFYLGLIIFIAMIGNLIIAGVFGYVIPILLKKVNIDPAIASSIFLTTLTDVGGFFIFLMLAKIFLPFLK
ncbi:magnesium transporter [Enterococcus cecorum]|uniref:magnesium transporter n=7 Tax=Enterococcus cecorum TaxID=44008 RepID=UPI00148B9987|nr:magnesium transporter [Enterococcus cecorum]MCJ0538040.1 magnesium transporter [Enterococcus cecorum]MCJ0544117.1 magnesium transporter [Enterococcus cecorum]MCJ0545886.1 magnesium transporter [Enterococcus cecorum]MCJ0548643.1 magnesium transporter [Enterococcus cecorum]MCJ0549662.1 magnesium transporter [Enterococcus cecorum]